MTVPPTSRAPAAVARLTRVRTLARLMDTSIGIPGTRFRIGLDPLLGIVPWVGDVVGALISTYLVWQSARLGAPAAMLARMTLNVATETVVGVVPVIGDLFDAGFKANTRNLKLLERHLEEPGAAALSARRFWLGVAGALVGSVVGMVVVAGWLLWWVLGLVGLV